ncbi:Gfo/Idh/MocA family oxidoreductase, partial [Enterococcus faecalis]|nr:Gfo/Idh/MocA family oxidoreductase [Enterococcus faecalis]
MDKETIKVGIVGGSANPKSWAINSHIPALQKNKNFELIAVSTSTKESAMEAKKLFQTKYAYDSYHKLIRNTEIDLVVVSVKVEFHYEIIKKALLYKKHVYSEWPLTSSLEQSKELVELAKKQKVQNIIGLQARQSPALKNAKEIIDTKLGAVLNVREVVSTSGKGKIANNRTVYQYDSKAGATLLDINGGHSLDILNFLLGDFSQIKASPTKHFGMVLNEDTQKFFKQQSPDSWEIIGKINHDISFNSSIHGGVRSYFEIVFEGENGNIRIYQKEPTGHPQFGNLVLEV